MTAPLSRRFGRRGSINLERPEIAKTRATEHLAEMIQIIETCLKTAELTNPMLDYYRFSAFPNTQAVENKVLKATSSAAASALPDKTKERADFALWKLVGETESGLGREFRAVAGWHSKARDAINIWRELRHSACALIYSFRVTKTKSLIRRRTEKLLHMAAREF